MAESKRARRVLESLILAAGALALAGLLGSPASAEEPSGQPIQVARASEASSVAFQGPVEMAAGDPLGQHVFPNEFAAFEDALPNTALRHETPPLSPREFRQQILRWISQSGAVGPYPPR